jgi:glyoxylase-like metal-dependent hydrolase (beta-lactamase superfamily II)
MTTRSFATPSSSISSKGTNLPPPSSKPSSGWSPQGHTPYQIHPIFGKGSARVLFTGDVIPTSAHLPLTWGMGFDLQPLQIMEEKRTIYNRCRPDGILLAFPHDPKVAAVELDQTTEKPIVKRSVEL